MLHPMVQMLLLLRMELRTGHPVRRATAWFLSDVLVHVISKLWELCQFRFQIKGYKILKFIGDNAKILYRNRFGSDAYCFVDTGFRPHFITTKKLCCACCVNSSRQSLNALES